MCNSKNRYKLFLNNNNFISGTDSRWTINLPSFIPVNKQCFIFIETAQIQIKTNHIHIQENSLMLNSSITSTNVYSQNSGTYGSQLCQFNVPIIAGHAGSEEYLKIDNPTTPIFCNSIPNNIEFYISDNDSVPIDISGCEVDFIMIIEFIDE